MKQNPPHNSMLDKSLTHVDCRLESLLEQIPLIRKAIRRADEDMHHRTDSGYRGTIAEEPLQKLQEECARLQVLREEVEDLLAAQSSIGVIDFKIEILIDEIDDLLEESRELILSLRPSLAEESAHSSKL